MHICCIPQQPTHNEGEATTWKEIRTLVAEEGEMNTENWKKEKEKNSLQMVSPEPALCIVSIKSRCPFNPWVWKISWKRQWQPTPVFLPGRAHGQRLVVYSPWGHKELDMAERLNNDYYECNEILKWKWKLRSRDITDGTSRARCKPVVHNLQRGQKLAVLNPSVGGF